MTTLWHAKSQEETIAELDTGERGLSEEEARRRLARYGPNKLPDTPTDGFFLIFLRQFRSPLIYILLAASAAVFAMGESADGLIILAVLVFNAIVGTVQEGKAQNTLRALRNFVETKATVVRSGNEMIITDAEVVPGDLIILYEGEKIPADARVLVSNNLKTDESALTGESVPVHKIANKVRSEQVRNHYENIVYKSTHVVAGNGRAIVIATGSKTNVGLIAKSIATIDTEIPLKSDIRYLSRIVIATVALVSLAVFVLGLSKGIPIKEIFATVVSLAVSVVPEGLPIVVTLILAMGVQRMSRRNALVKRLQAVEALGQAQIIAVDKTGTITKNELMIRKVYAGGKMFEIGGVGYVPEGNVLLDGKAVDAANHPELLLAGKVAAFCANAHVTYLGDEGRWRVTGDPTEAAILVLSQKLGFHKDDLEKEHKNIGDIPFDYKLKYHATLHETDGKGLLTVVGAPESILRLSTSVERDGRREPMTTKDREEFENLFYEMSREGLRVVAFAIYPDAGRSLSPDTIHSLTFLGFYGMQDILRPEVADTVRRAYAAGVRIVMITGDHMVTAEAIAREAGIWKSGGSVLSGQDIDALSNDQLADKLGQVSVFARVNPEHKLRIIEAYRSAGLIVAMTGDGVNDAPSLVAADLGVAMGKVGTEVAKEASDIVLLDDNIGSMISAIEEGRSIYKTIKKVILYLFSTSIGEAFTIIGALAFGYPLPIMPAQIIWLNFVTDGFLDVSLAMEPKGNHLLDGKFDRPKKYIVDRLMVQRMMIISIVMAVGTLYLFKKYYIADVAKASTVTLTVLAVFQWFNAWNCRSEKRSVFTMNPFSNKTLFAATILVVALQMIAIYAPIMQKYLRTVPLDWSDWAIIVPVAVSVIAAEELRKAFARRSITNSLP